MRQKEEKWIVTFPSAAAAMAMEQRAKKRGTPGRLIPTPTVITADCGLAWMTRIDDRDAVEELLRTEQLAHSEMLALWL